MGAVDTIGIDKWPEQGTYFGKNVKVCFHFNTLQTIDGVVVRDDVEEPYVMIIKLEDGRFVLSTECQYSVSK